jgi:hypothetical protein
LAFAMSRTPIDMWSNMDRFSSCGGSSRRGPAVLLA